MWFAVCDVKTGQVLAELPLKIDSELQRGMQTISSGSFTLPIYDARCPKEWELLTIPMRYWICCVSEDVIVWAGIIESRHRKTSSGMVGLSCVSPEDYLDRRYVPSKRFDQVDQTEIVKWFISLANTDGLPFVVDGKLSGIRRDREYHEDETASVYQRLSELSNVIGGPEWHITVEWANENYSAIVPVVRVGAPRIGRASKAPMAVFEMPGGLLDVAFEERYGAREFATHVVAVGGGEGEDRPMSDPIISTNVEIAGWPRCEIRKTFDSVTQKTTLNSHANSLLGSLKNGVGVWSLTQKIDQYPRLGVDWSMGDDVRLIVNTGVLKADTILRVVGWSISSNMQTLTPHVAKIGGQNG